jgi:hypothetical protein
MVFGNFASSQENMLRKVDLSLGVLTLFAGAKGSTWS